LLQLRPKTSYVYSKDLYEQIRDKSYGAKELLALMLTPHQYFLASDIFNYLFNSDWTVEHLEKAVALTQKIFNNDLALDIIAEIFKLKEKCELKHGSTIRKAVVLGRLEMHMLKNVKLTNTVTWVTRHSKPAFRGYIFQTDVLASTDLSGIHVEPYGQDKLSRLNLYTGD
jgi:hypothetical protein